MIYQHRKCPICNSEEVDLSSQIKSDPEAEKLSLNKLTDSWLGFFKIKLFMSYFKCKECKLLYCPKYFSQEQLSTLYKDMPHNMDCVPTNLLDKTQEDYLNFLKKFSSLEGNYLEVGADIGLFLKHAKNNGNFSKYYIYEPNISSHTRLIKEIGSSEKLLSNNMENFNEVPNNSIDNAIMIHVIDHVTDPLQKLRDLKDKLINNSKILIVCHDENSLLRKIFRAKWPAFCLQHPQLFNIDTLSNLLSTAGYEVIENKKSKNYFDLEFLINHLIWALGINKTFKFNLFKKISYGLKLGNIIFVAQPKKKQN